MSETKKKAFVRPRIVRRKEKLQEIVLFATGESTEKAPDKPKGDDPQ